MAHFKIDSLIENRLYPLVKLIDKLSWIMLFALMTMTAIDLFLRNFTNTSILGSVELTELMMVIIVFCSLAQCELDNGHIRIDLIMDHAGKRTRAFADVFTQALCTVIFALMSLSIFNHSINMKEYGEVTMDLNIPLYPFIFIACLGCVVMTLVLFSKTIINILKAAGS
ncbi:MAG: TRAP transporter small permease [Deltaproteobacteria bacterium]|nr:TRAP transporter small permease [Deltaproteobacteria bacterium]